MEYIVSGIITMCLLYHSAGAGMSLNTSNSAHFMSDYSSFPDYTNQRLIFRVKGGRGGQIWLLSHSRSTLHPYYRLLIGATGNTQSKLKNQNVLLAEHNRSELDINVYKELWFYWGNGMLQVGRGATIGTETFLSYIQECPFAVKDIYIRSNPNLSWIFEDQTNDLSSEGDGNLVQKYYKSANNCPLFQQLLITVSSSFIECTMICTQKMECHAINFFKETLKCELSTGDVATNTVSNYFVRM